MSNNKAFKVKNGLELADYNKSISDTAVDVFVYDTRKDSDGGAWRKRTQHTSWYNETLNTATRGSRKEFPAVAVIVVETAQVTIYDGDDPDLPMWKSIGVSGDSYYTDQSAILGSGGDVTSVSALNGLLSIGSNTGASGTTSMNGLTRINLIADYVYGTNATYTYKWLGSLGDTATQAYWTSLGTGTVIVNLNVNDVAMTVLPNAPIDAATGLPVPTIAVATDGGVSVIKDDGTVVDWYRYDGNEFCHQVAFDENNSLFVTWGTTNGQERHLSYLDAIPSSDDNQMTDNYYNSYNGVGSTAFGSSGQGILSNNARAFAAKTGRQRLFLLDHNRNNTDNSSVCDITSSYNTGWMNGNIKLATLSDTDATNVTGSEITTDGTFSDTANWTEGDAAWSVTGGALVGTSVPNNKYTGQSITSISSGTLLTAVITVSSYTAGNLNFSLRDVEGGTNETPVSFGVNGTGTFTATIRTTQANAWLEVLSSGTTTMTIDDISVRLAEEDRSVNGNGLQVFGTVTKSYVDEV